MKTSRDNVNDVIVRFVLVRANQMHERVIHFFFFCLTLTKAGFKPKISKKQFCELLLQLN